jgi:hypothetical protein
MQGQHRLQQRPLHSGGCLLQFGLYRRVPELRSFGQGRNLRQYRFWGIPAGQHDVRGW